MWKSKFYDAFVLNHIVVLHAIDATPARRRGGVDSSPLDGASTARRRNYLVKNYRVHPTYWLISTQVLIVHPFADTIRDQYAKHAAGDLLWPEAVLPRDLNLVIVKAPSSLGRDANGTWSQALLDTKAAIDGAFPVDAALLGCGAYGLPLAAHVVSGGASAVYVGGGLQLLFGIMGKRWADRAEIAAVARESWVWPSPAETPPRAEVVEGGAYWGL